MKFRLVLAVGISAPASSNAWADPHPDVKITGKQQAQFDPAHPDHKRGTLFISSFASPAMPVLYELGQHVVGGSRRYGPYPNTAPAAAGPLHVAERPRDPRQAGRAILAFLFHY
jgi:hypothetical protein